MSVFADASAVVKLFATEEGSDRFRAEPGPVAISALTRVETASALWRKSRDGALRPHQAQVLVTGLQAQLADNHFDHGVAVVEAPVSVEVLDRATRLCAIHGLRAGDAIQLATALAVRRADPSCTGFWVFDGRLAGAVAREDFTVFGADDS